MRYHTPGCALITALVACAAVLGLAPAARGEEIPATVTDLRVVGEKARVAFAVKNGSSAERLVAWSVWIVLEYPDGHVARKGYAVHCHLTSDEKATRDCELGPGQKREQPPVGIPLREGQFPILTSGYVESAIFEGANGARERWVGNRDGLRPLVDGYAERQRVWGEILRLLETGSGARHEGSPARAALDRLNREGPNHPVTDSVRTQLARAVARSTEIAAHGDDVLAGIIRTARVESSHRTPHSPE